MAGKLYFDDAKTGRYSITKKRSAKRITLRISKDGTPNVTIPQYATLQSGHRFLQSHREWVEEHSQPQIRFTEGQHYELYDGTLVSISRGGDRNSHNYTRGRLTIKCKSSDEQDYIRKTITKHLALDSENAIRPRVEKFQTQLSVSASALRFRATTSRWGSCNSKAQLTFSVYIAQLPNELIDYIVIHELSHIREMNHSARFWAQVARHDPSYKQHRKELKQYELRPHLKKL